MASCWSTRQCASLKSLCEFIFKFYTDEIITCTINLPSQKSTTNIWILYWPNSWDIVREQRRGMRIEKGKQGGWIWGQKLWSEVRKKRVKENKNESRWRGGRRAVREVELRERVGRSVEHTVTSRIPPTSLSQSMWQEDLCNTPEMEGGDGERVTRRRMKEGARRAAVKGVMQRKRSG